MNKRVVGIFEISIILISSFAFSYLISQTNEISLGTNIPQESKTIKYVRNKILNYLSNGIVSAQSSVWTCPLDRNENYCQEYPSTTCNSQCASSCFPGRRADFSECSIGTCYDTSLGICSSGSPKKLCESNDGVWYQNQPVQCNRGCCLIGFNNAGTSDQAKFTTSQECNYLGQKLGSGVQWDPQITSEIQCLSKVKSQKEGACKLEFLPELNKYNCKLTTEISCLNSGGEFYQGKLCTNNQLNTKCERTQNTACFEGKDGVYFVDGCGNRANVYDSSKINDVSYWNEIISLSNSCSLSSNSNPLSNQQKCGNCDYIGGSICGSPTTSDKSPIYGQYVCKDLSCTDENGKKRSHGESWCAFDGQIGVDGAKGSNEERSVDLPGSRHYRELCYDGEVRIEPCAEYRNEICIEEDVGSKGFTNAQCKVNTGNLCLQYNKDDESLGKCEENSDCFLKHVSIDKMEFDACVPKYPQGFEITDESEEDSKTICAVATQTCTYYEKKGIDGKWSCKVNCECKDAAFAEKMNNLCMSLGDCGSQINLAGDLGNGYSTTGDKTPKISDNYIQSLKKYSTPVQGQRVSTNIGDIQDILGKNFGFKPNDVASKISQLGLGASGLLSIYIYHFSSVGAEILPSGFIGPATEAQASASTWVSFSSYVNTLAVGAGVGYILGTIFGLEDKSLIVATVAGVAGSFFAYQAGAGFLASPITLLIVAVLSTILGILGIGKYRERSVTFNCLPWQPPSGGDSCSKCNDLGIECTSYKCSSLGKNCELINQGTGNEQCININPNDASAPEIKLNTTSLPNGFGYETLNQGIKIKSNSGDECIQEYSAVSFDILTNEPSQCKISSTRPDKGYEEMEDNFFDSSSNSYTLNHIENTAMQTLDALGVSGVDPARRGNYDLYVLCEDKNGNSAPSAYNVRFCVSPANDVQPPKITKFVPEQGFSAIDANSFNLEFYTNEPATCKFSNVDESYDSMSSYANCYNEISQSTLYGWLCKSTLNITENTNDYYFRCADQPWLGSNYGGNSNSLENGRNSNSQSERYTVRRTSTPLTISSATPNNVTISSGSEPVSVDLDVITNGGIDNGKSFCKFSLNDGEQYIDFRNTNSVNHKQTFNALFSGNHKIKLRCIDAANNIVESEVSFNIEVDSIGPLITRVYNSGNTLTVITNEASICEYSTSSCSFSFEEGNSLSGSGRSHTMSYSNGLTYSIKCKDSFNNIGSCLTVSGGY